MLILIATTIVIILPILAYLLHPLSSQKSTVFLIAFFLFGAFTSNFLSQNPVLGSWQKIGQSESIDSLAQINAEFPSSLILVFINHADSKENSFLLGAEVFYRALELGSFTSAESLLKILSAKFQDESYQIPVYNLLADLRDAKYPWVAESKVFLRMDSPPQCKPQRLDINVKLINGPQVSIAQKEYLIPDFKELFFADKSDAIIKGFDLPSAFINGEIIKIDVSSQCNKDKFFVTKTLDLSTSENSQEMVVIYSNEWLIKSQ